MISGSYRRASLALGVDDPLPPETAIPQSGEVASPLWLRLHLSVPHDRGAALPLRSFRPDDQVEKYVSLYRHVATLNQRFEQMHHMHAVHGADCDSIRNSHEFLDRL